MYDYIKVFACGQRAWFPTEYSHDFISKIATSRGKINPDMSVEEGRHRKIRLGAVQTWLQICECCWKIFSFVILMLNYADQCEIALVISLAQIPLWMLGLTTRRPPAHGWKFPAGYVVVATTETPYHCMGISIGLGYFWMKLHASGKILVIKKRKFLELVST